jgi:phosphatidate cytidylyltransferase
MMVALFGCIWLTDAAAYGGGRAWGQRRLVPTISPAKTVVGFVCGLGGGLVPLLLWRQLPSWSLLELGGLFLCVSLGSQMGDIVESAIKRDLGVKDAPTLIPGHGGVLDRFDSYLFAFPVAYLYTAVFRS